jgi:hypothetical protein
LFVLGFSFIVFFYVHGAFWLVLSQLSLSSIVCCVLDSDRTEAARSRIFGPREALPEDCICFEVFVLVSLESCFSSCAQFVLARYVPVISLPLVVCCFFRLRENLIEAARSAARRF